MDKVLSVKVRLAWLFLAILASAFAGIIGVLVMRSGPPANAVLIEALEEPTAVRSGSSTGLALRSPAGTVTVAESDGTIAVYVSGAVASPGVYTLTDGSRIADAVEAAGGAMDDADLDRINLAARVSDEEHIVVPEVGVEPQVTLVTPTTVEQSSRATRETPDGMKLDLNGATAAELEELPGIGPVLASRIVEDRDLNGEFKSVEDLARVSGIKEGILAQVRGYLVVRP